MRLVRAGALLGPLAAAAALEAQERPALEPAVDFPVARLDLSRQLANPVAALFSVPVQLSSELEPGAGAPRTVLSFRPVLPIALSSVENLVVRLVASVIHDGAPAGDRTSALGLGDSLLSLFYAPPPVAGIIGAAGPALALPLSSEAALGSGKWSIGPTAAILAQPGAWTVGAQFTQLWSFAGDRDRPVVNQTLIQPFVAYHAATSFTLTLDSDIEGRWLPAVGEDWIAPIQLSATKVARLGSAPIGVLGGVGYYVARREDGPRWLLRTSFSLLSPG